MAGKKSESLGTAGKLHSLAHVLLVSSHEVKSVKDGVPSALTVTLHTEGRSPNGGVPWAGHGKSNFQFLPFTVLGH